jgi:hypothetical protein
MKPEIKLYTRVETAKALRISTVHLWKITKQGQLHPTRIGCRVLYSADELQRFAGVTA